MFPFSLWPSSSFGFLVILDLRCMLSQSYCAYKSSSLHVVLNCILLNDSLDTIMAI